MKTFEEFKFSIPHNKVKGYKYSPSTKDEFIKAIRTEIKLQGPEADLNCINTSKITDMQNIFDAFRHEYAGSFNGEIGAWDVSNVKDMYCMFSDAKSFNGDIGDWNVSNVEDMYGMFNGAESFNQDISGWNVSSVKDIAWMFDKCPIKEEYKPKFK